MTTTAPLAPTIIGIGMSGAVTGPGVVGGVVTGVVPVVVDEVVHSV